jgi:hypothetical protein
MNTTTTTTTTTLRNTTTMDPDTTLLNLLNLFLADRPAVTCEVTEATEALTQWHNSRGYLPRWPVHLNSGFHFARVPCGQEEPAAELLYRSECIALLTRVQVAIEAEHRSVYVEAVRNLGSWARRALDPEDQPSLQLPPGHPSDLVGHDVKCEGISYRCISVDPHNTAQVILRRMAPLDSPKYRVHWGLCSIIERHLPADWRCPTCKTPTGTPHSFQVICANGHESF